MNTTREHRFSESSDYQQCFEQLNKNIISVLEKESESIDFLSQNLPDNVLVLADKIGKIKGKIAFTGSGKSGLIGKKLSSTFSSLGMPSVFLHPHDALHGDIGMLAIQDFVIILSKSASGSELEVMLSYLQHHKIDSALMCCSQGPLVQKTNLSVIIPFSKEACNLQLAPTSSSTVMLALGDALAVAVSSMKKFSHKDFAMNHPAGALGKKLLFKVSSFMAQREDIPFLDKDVLFGDAVVIITKKKRGIGIVTDQQGKLLGVVTDGDLRRACQKGASIFDTKVSEFMTTKVKIIDKNMLAYDALKLMEDYAITSLVVTKNEKVVGFVHIHDLVKAGLKD
jgi:arabinose-5-phosphate isomerase